MADGVCPTESHELVESADDCEMLAFELGLSDVTARSIKNSKNPKGCFFKKNVLLFNSRGKTNSKNKRKQAICCSVPETTSTNVPSYYGGYDFGYNGNGGGNSCECKSEWQFDGETYEQCAFTPDDPDNSWCYTGSECEESSPSESYAGANWVYCNVRDNKRIAFGAGVQHSSAGASSASADDANSAAGGSSAGGVATAAAGIVAALLVVGALVVVVVHRRRATAGRNLDATIADVEDGGIAIPEDAALDGLERAVSYHDALSSAAAPAAEPTADDFSAAQFVLDAAAGGSLKVKSVRRPNPAYRSSAYIENSATDGV